MDRAKAREASGASRVGDHVLPRDDRPRLEIDSYRGHDTPASQSPLIRLIPCSVNDIIAIAGPVRKKIGAANQYFSGPLRIGK